MNLITLDAHIERYPYLLASMRQRLAVEADGRPLDADGRLGPRSRAARYADLGELLASHPLVAVMAICAVAGAGEEDANNAGAWPGCAMARAADPSIGRRQRHPQWDPQAPRDRVASLAYAGGAWCAGMVSLAITHVWGDRRELTSWGAADLVARWRRAGAQAVEAEQATAGDLIAWRTPDGSGGHVGVICGRVGEQLLALEGNGSRTRGQVGLYGYERAQGYTRGRQHLHLIVRPHL